MSVVYYINNRSSSYVKGVIHLFHPSSSRSRESLTHPYLYLKSKLFPHTHKLLVLSIDPWYKELTYKLTYIKIVKIFLSLELTRIPLWQQFQSGYVMSHRLRGTNSIMDLNKKSTSPLNSSHLSFPLRPRFQPFLG